MISKSKKVISAQSAGLMQYDHDQAAKKSCSEEK